MGFGRIVEAFDFLPYEEAWNSFTDSFSFSAGLDQTTDFLLEQGQEFTQFLNYDGDYNQYAQRYGRNQRGTARAVYIDRLAKAAREAERIALERQRERRRRRNDLESKANRRRRRAAGSNITIDSDHLFFSDTDLKFRAQVDDGEQVPTFNRPMSIHARDQKATMALRSDVDATSIYHQEFILTDINEEHSEKYQLLETHGDWSAIFSGKNASFMNLGGALMDGRDVDANWANRMRRLYDETARGSQATLAGRQVWFFVNGRIIEGAITNLTIQQTAVSDRIASFSMVMILLSDKEVRTERNTIVG